MLKLCKDCKYLSIENPIEEYLQNPIEEYLQNARCKHPGLTVTDLVSGTIYHPFCAAERKSSHILCGPNGKLWEPKDAIE